LYKILGDDVKIRANLVQNKFLPHSDGPKRKLISKLQCTAQNGNTLQRTV